MENGIKELENVVAVLKKRINSQYKDIENHNMTEVGYAILRKRQQDLDYYDGELEGLKELPKCNCVGFVKLFSKEYKKFNFTTICQCRKCGGYFSK